MVTPPSPPPSWRIEPYRIEALRIEALLGAGGMGEVYRARCAARPDPVALKRIRSTVAKTPEQRRRVLRQAALVARLHHPAVVRVYDGFEARGSAWIVMEYVPGPTLAQRLQRGVLPWPEALGLGRQITAGLAAAHEAGIVHCDLKVENVMVTPAGQAKIVDFGIARHLGETLVPTAGRIVGTPRVMSPEQVMGLRVDPRSDLFSLGVLFYEILTGLSPFAGEPADRILARVCTHCPPPLEGRILTLPPGLSRLVQGLLEKDPARRPQSAREVLAWLERLTAAEPSMEVPPTLPPFRMSGDTTTQSTGWTG